MGKLHSASEVCFTSGDCATDLRGKRKLRSQPSGFVDLSGALGNEGVPVPRMLAVPASPA